MKAILLNEHGGSDKLVYTEEAAMPQVKTGEALVKIKATSVNRADLVVRAGYPGLSLPMPHILGGDIVGVIEEIGENEFGLQNGDRVIALPVINLDPDFSKVSASNKPYHEHLAINWHYFGMHINGSYAEYAAVPNKNLVKLPDNVTFEDATSLGVAGLTAYHAIQSVGALQAGEIFMIWGGSGGLGTIAVQLAKASGAIVIATVGKDEKIDKIKSLGADYVFNHYTQDVMAEVKKIFPFGVDMIIDYVGPKTFQTSFDLLKKGGRILLCGILTGRETNFSIHLAYLKHISVHGLYLGTKAELEQVVKLAGEGKIKGEISQVLPLAEASKAHDIIASGDYTGKIVLVP